MNPLIQLKTTPPLLITLVLLCFGLLPTTQAVVPAPDGGYPGQNTAEGQSALLHLAGGTYNTALGWSSLGFNITGNYNTAIGAGALLANTADENTATGAGALLSNTIGASNTANGAFALFSNTEGFENTAVGAFALFNNVGFNNFGNLNTAVGGMALFSNTNGGSNTAIGDGALSNSPTGGGNTALGADAGVFVTTADNVICIGAGVGENVSNSCYIGNIFGSTSSNGVAVLVNSNGRLGTMTSSARFKDEIKPMDKASEAVFALKPVTFRYKKEIDPAGASQFGLVAEEVEKVNPDLIVRDKEGKPYSVRYDQVNAMLLNEFLKEHSKMEEQQATITQLKSAVAQQEKNFQATAAQQQRQIEALTAGLQKVSAQLAAASPSRGGLEASKPAPQVVNNP